jgi:hypothetical protein
MASSSIHFREAPVSGHLFRKARRSGDRWMAKWRDVEGQHQVVLGRVWTKRGRPSEGYLTKQGAQRELDAILADARQTNLTSRPRRSSTVTSGEAARESTLVVHKSSHSPTSRRIWATPASRRTMIYVHHVPRIDAAERLSSALRKAATTVPDEQVAA